MFGAIPSQIWTFGDHNQKLSGDDGGGLGVDMILVASLFH